MKRRCLNQTCPEYADYGGRGIQVCDRWARSFLSFLEDMGEKPEWASGGLDRIDVNGNYEPSNCRWATSRQQALNKRRVQCAERWLSEWEAQYGPDTTLAEVRQAVAA